MNTERDNQPEAIQPIVNSAELPVFPVLYRFRFGSDQNRVYFRKDFDRFYSGLTGPISKSGLVDFTGLNKARVNMAFEGQDADAIWIERREYGSAFHVIVSNHERRDSERQVFVFDEMTPEGIAWREYVYKYAASWGFSSYAEQWERDIQNDMAAWFTFKKEKEVKVLASEIVCYNDEWLVATPLDIVCGMKFGQKRILANINLKTGTSGGENKSYSLQSVMEAMLWDETMRREKAEKFLLGGTFTWRPTDRSISPGGFVLSKNYLGAHSQDEIDHILRTVRLCKLNEPKGCIRKYTGSEENFEVKTTTANEYLAEFNKQTVTI